MTTQDFTGHKAAAIDHEIHELLKWRWSPRAFADRVIDRDTLLRLFEAARWAPSSFNEQPWRFLVAPKPDQQEFDRMLQCLSEGNRAWAHRAAVLAISVAKLAFDRNQKPNRHAFHDVGMAIENLSMQATALGITVHQMAGFNVQAARDTYAIPDGFEPVAAIAMGYPGSPEMLDEKNRASELASRSRHPIASFVFRGGWGQSF